MSTARALVLVALLLVPILPLAGAVGAEPRPWSGYDAVSNVNEIAIARGGTTVAAALAAPVPTSTGGATPSANCAPVSILPGEAGAPVCALTDLLALDHQYGFAQNLTYYGQDIEGSTPTQPRVQTPPGRTHVAVSRDGTAVASLGLAYTPDGTAERASFYYGRTTGNWSTAGTFNRSFDLGAPEDVTLVDVVLSDDGRRAAVLFGAGGQYVLRGYTATSSNVESAFEVRAPGTPRALAAAGDLSRILVAGQFPQGNLTHGGAYVLPFSQGAPLASTFDAAANGTDVRSAAMSRDGAVAALADAAGKVRVFRDAALAAPLVANVSSLAVNVTMSDDGARLAAYANTSLVLLDINGTPTPRWNGTVPGGSISAVAIDGKGDLVVAGSSGSGGGVYAYGVDDARPLWQILGETRSVAIDSSGTRVAYAQRAAISGANVPRQLSVEASGSTTRVIAPPANASYEVVLRNDGGALERVVFEETSPGIAIPATAPVSVRPGEVVRRNVTVEVEAGLVGPRAFDVTARSLTSNISRTLTFTVSPTPILDVTLHVNETDLVARPGQASELLLQVVNNGTGDADVQIRATQTVSTGPLWNLTLNEGIFTVLRGTRTTVGVTMTPPPGAENGTAATVDFVVEGLNVFDTARVVWRINPTLAVEVNATGVTRFIEPGDKAFYNVTVTNTGSLPRQFELVYAITSNDGRNWGVDMQAQTARIEPQQRRVIPVAIVAPADAQPDERVAVLVSARSIPELPNETLVQDNVTLFGIAIPPKVTTTTTPGNGIPAPGLVLVVAAVVLLALARRRA